MSQYVFDGNESGATARTKFNEMLAELYASGYYIEVQNYAALPTASEHTGEIYVCLEDQGTWILGTKKAAGLYYSNGSSWGRLGPAVNAAMVYLAPVAGLVAVDVQAAIEELQAIVPTTDEKAAMSAANSPTISNPFATVADLQPILISAASVNVVVGGTVTGVVAGTHTANDGELYRVNEVGTTPGFDVRFTFTSVTSFNQVVARLEYGGTQGHDWWADLYNVGTTQWDHLHPAAFHDTGDQAWISFGVSDDSAYINGSNQVQVRLYHSSNGTVGHFVEVDLIALMDSGLGAANTLHGALAGRDAVDQHPIAAITGLQSSLIAKQDVLETEYPTVPRRVYFVYGDSTDGGTTPDTATQESIDYLLNVANIPADNIRWLYEVDTTSNLVIQNAISVTSSDNVVLTRVGGLFTIQDAIGSTSADNVVLVDASALNLVIQDSISSTSSDNIVLVRVGGLLVVQDAVSASAADNVILQAIEGGTTIYANTSDAQIGASGASFSGVRGLAGADLASATNTTLTASAESYENGDFEQEWAINRAFLDFTIPSGSAITTATLSVYPTAKVGSPTLHIQSSSQAIPVVGGDFDSFPSAPNGTSLGNTGVIGTVNQYYPITSAGLISVVNALRVAGGTLKLVVREARDFNNSDPSMDENDQVDFNSGNAGSNQPKLVLE